MAQYKYKCTSFGICSEADTNKIIISSDINPVCPECKTTLRAVGNGLDINERKRFIIAAIISAVITIAIILYFIFHEETYSVVITSPNAEQGKIISTDSEKTLDCGLDCQHEYTKGTKLTLRAEAETGFRFLSWSGACEKSKNRGCSLTITEDKKVSATFDKIPDSPTLTITQPDSNQGKIVAATSESGNIDCGSDCSQQYVKGKKIKIVAKPEQGFEFQSWTGDCTGFKTNECSLTMDTDKQIGIVFTALENNNATLKILLLGEGTVKSENSDINCFITTGNEKHTCIKEYPKQTEVTLMATANEGYQLRQWGEACQQSAANQCTLILNENKNVIVIFEPKPKGNTPILPLPVIKKLKKIVSDCSDPPDINCIDNMINAINSTD